MTAIFLHNLTKFNNKLAFESEISNNPTTKTYYQFFIYKVEFSEPPWETKKTGKMG